MKKIHELDLNSGDWAKTLSDLLLVCAAGTTTSATAPLADVLFAANLENTIAVTGLKDFSMGLDYNPCSNCHYGEEVDFAVIMQRSDDSDRTALSLSCAGDDPSYTTGSSCATATFAGMAALVWERLGTDATAAAVIDKMRLACSEPDAGPNSFFGHGIVFMNNVLQ